MRKLAILIIALLLMSPAVASANLLSNPGFEEFGDIGQGEGGAKDWYWDWGTNVRRTADQPHSGTYAAHNYWDGGMYQDVLAITPGVDYRMTGWVYIPSGSAGAPWGSFIGINWLRSNYTMAGMWEKGDFANEPRDVYNMGDSGWITAPAEAAIARVRFGTWSDDPLIGPIRPTDFDDFSLTAIPEPSSLILLGTGLFGLFGFGTRRKKSRA